MLLTNSSFKLVLISFLFVTFLFMHTAEAQQQLQFNQLTQSFTNTILKDSDGFIWVGTQDGLMRYDNFRFKTYRYKSDIPYSLPNNYVKDIIEDNNHDLWLGTFGGGLVKWDRKLERFYTYPINTSAESIHSLALYQDSIILIGSENGLIHFNIKTKDTKNLSGKQDGEASKFINAIYISHEDDIFLGTNDGLFIYDPLNKKMDRLDIAENIIVYCIVGHAHRIYIGTNKGLVIYNKRKSTFEKYLIDKDITTILLTDSDDLYLGSNTGIVHYTKDDGYQWHTKADAVENGLQSDLIHTLCNLGDDILWAGTRKGIHQFSIRAPEFQSLNVQFAENGCSSTSLGMAEDKNSDVWICSRKGLMHLSLEGELPEWQSYCHTMSNTPGMRNDYTINVTADSNNDLWLAYRSNGFSRIREENKIWKWYNFPKASKALGGDGVNQVYQDLSGRYWLASRGKGLIRFFPEDESLKIYDEQSGLSHPYVFRIYQTQKGELWISTANGGLCKFDIESEKFQCQESNLKDPTSLSANMVLSTNKQSNGKLLVCTTDGLNILEQDGEFTKINTIDGLPNNVIYAALEDDNGKIWVSTNEGISKLDLLQNIPNVTNYNKSHGLASTEFNQHSFLEHSSGLFLLGGVEGVTVFNPTSIEDHKIVPGIAIIDFQLFNKSVPIGAHRNDEFSLEKAINKLDKIVLAHDQNSLAFEYSALGIINAENIIYQYKLEGLENEWVNAGRRNYAPYPKVSHGKYKFKVRLADLNKNAISQEKSVQIIILTPPWKTWWANVLYALILAGIIYLITRIQKARTLTIANARENERDVFRKKLARDFHDEAGNKITRISLITDNITRKSKDTEIKKTLNKLQDNIQDLRLGMTDFIWVLDPGKDSLSETLRRFMDFANETFEYTDIDFRMDTIPKELNEVPMESNVRRHFLLIMKEATTNILKHADAHEVIFSFRKVDDVWKFTISDDGNGFNIEEIKRVNGLNNMKTRAEKIGGNLEIQNNEKGGTSILLNIPI